MAELRLSDEQQQQLSDLLNQLAQDDALRRRLEADPRGVLGDFGLEALIPEGEESEGIEVTLEEPEVAGYLLAHTDWHRDGHLDGHQDSHADIHCDAPVVGRVGMLPSISIRYAG